MRRRDDDAYPARAEDPGQTRHFVEDVPLLDGREKDEGFGTASQGYHGNPELVDGLDERGA